MTTVFVFGSNLGGRHGKGAALTARKKHGAIYGRAEGPQGRSYGIPTKNSVLEPLPLEQIHAAVERFLVFAQKHQNVIFEISEIGCGLAGYKPTEIGPMFAEAPDNCILPYSFDVAIESMKGITNESPSYEG